MRSHPPAGIARPDVRRDAFQAYYGEWAGNRATVAAALDGRFVLICSRRRRAALAPCLEASLFQDQ